MTNTKLFLLIGTSLSLIPQTINAQCVATQDCATLGYTESSCSGGSGVKCPFGNKWACFKTDAEYEQEFCSKYGFTQTCTGTNQTGGSGKACGGKYAQCNCASGYKWQQNKCQPPLTGAYGDLYYCNGIVVGVKAADMDFYVAMNDIGKMDWNDTQQACKVYVFCGQTKGRAPSGGELYSIYKNKAYINALLTENGGSNISETTYWSSYKYEYDCIQSPTQWNACYPQYEYGYINMVSGKRYYADNAPDTNRSVRPVLEI